MTNETLNVVEKVLGTKYLSTVKGSFNCLTTKEAVEKIGNFFSIYNTAVKETIVALALLANNEGKGCVKIAARFPIISNKDFTFIYEDENGETWDSDGPKAMKRFESKKENFTFDKTCVVWEIVESKAFDSLCNNYSIDVKSLLNHIYR